MQARVLWSLLWRSVLLFPLGVLITFAVVAFPVVLSGLRLGAAWCVIYGQWLSGAATLAALIPLFGARHWLVGRLINDHEPSGFL